MGKPAPTDKKALLYKSAITLRDAGQCPFTLATLAVHAHEENPGKFALTGYPRYVDFHAFRGLIDGEHGMRAGGNLVRLENGMYRPGVPTMGMAEGERFITRSEMDRLSDTEAARKYAAGQQRNITRYEAFEFWGIIDAMKHDAVEARLMELGMLLQPRETEQQRELCNLHEWLEQAFKRQLRLVEGAA